LPDTKKDACNEYFLATYHDARHSLLTIFKAVEETFALIIGMGLNIFKHLAYWKRIYFNTDEKVDLAKLHIGTGLRYTGGIL